MRNLVLSGLILGSVCAYAADPSLAELTNQAREAGKELQKQIRSELAREMDRTGPLRAIAVCKYSAPEATSAISRRTGMRISRVSLHARNPSLSEPDAWEQRVLLNFEKRVNAGESGANLEFSQIVNEPAGRYFRYMKAIMMEAACVTCHGKGISEGIKAQLAAEYPHDPAANVEPGSLRGALSVKKPLP